MRILHNVHLNNSLYATRRPDTFSLGVCNGCQLMALLGWVPGSEARLPDTSQPRFIYNTSGRFECRWATVHIKQDSPAIMLKVCSLCRLVQHWSRPLACPQNIPQHHEHCKNCIMRNIIVLSDVYVCSVYAADTCLAADVGQAFLSHIQTHRGPKSHAKCLMILVSSNPMPTCVLQHAEGKNRELFVKHHQQKWCVGISEVS